MSRINPCTPDCPDRTVGCQASCEKLLAAKELQRKRAEALRRDSMIRGYFKDKVRRRSRHSK